MMVRSPNPSPAFAAPTSPAAPASGSSVTPTTSAERGFAPLGLEILSVAVSSDADHIITPSSEGPRRAIDQALDEAGIAPEDVATWDMHATATPGDWSELQNIL